MAVGKEARGPLWVDGQITARVQAPGPSAGRIARIRRPFALIGRLPGADVRIDDPAVDPRHALLLLDGRGVFGVDLLTETGTRFAGAAAGSAWLGAGDILEIAGHRIELLRLRVDGRAIDPPLCRADPLSPHDGADGELASITLEPLDAPGPPWMLGSALAFLGRGDACAIRVANASASKTHCALIRGRSDAYVIDLLGRRTLLNDRPVDGASALLDGDVLTVGQARFGIRIGPPDPSRPIRRGGTGLALRQAAGLPPARLARPVPGPAASTPDLPRGTPQADLMEWLIGAIMQGADSSRAEVLEAVRRLHLDTSALLETQIDRIESLNRELATLRAEVRGHRGPPLPAAAPLRLDLGDASSRVPSAESATWLLDRLNGLEVDGRSSWKDLLGRIVAAVHPRPDRTHPAGTAQDPGSGPSRSPDEPPP